MSAAETEPRLLSRQRGETSSPMEAREVSCSYAHHEHERIAHDGSNVGFPTRTLSDASGTHSGQWC
jgi:hypothetical protein